MSLAWAAAILALSAGLSGCALEPHRAVPPLPSPSEVDAEVQRMMRGTGARGLALAVIDAGKVVQLSTFGSRNESGAPLEATSIMYGASLTKMAFAYLVLQLVDEGKLDLDRSIAEYLPEPLTAYTNPRIGNRRYARWSDLAGDDRWKALTPRILLSHASGFANFGFLEPDGKLRFHFQPGTRYAYSGDGIVLLQFVLEQGLGLDVEQEMQRRIFQPLGMRDTSLAWRRDFAGRVADGWTIDGKAVPHDVRSTVRASGSMDTTIADMAALVAGIVRGDRLSARSRREFSRAQLPVTTDSQFPTLQAEAPASRRWRGLAAGLGVLVFDGAQGAGFFKGGHNDSTGNMVVCLEASRRCVAVLGNDLRAEAAIPHLVEFILGPTGLPWPWEYGEADFWKPVASAR
jgi:CubicO group peptidase (beta-lactamase class C family)